jgi:hypothetical protein
MNRQRIPCIEKSLIRKPELLFLSLKFKASQIRKSIIIKVSSKEFLTSTQIIQVSQIFKLTRFSQTMKGEYSRALDMT